MPLAVTVSDVPTGRRSFAFSLVGAVLLLGACGSDVPADYSAETTDDFFAACTEPVEDSILRTRLCQCVIDTIQVEIPYEEFVELDAELAVEEPRIATPPVLVDVIARCVIDEADL